MLGWLRRGADVRPTAVPGLKVSSGGAAFPESRPGAISAHSEPDRLLSVSMSVCEHGVATTCPACIAIAAERGRIEAMPYPRWLEIDDHVAHLIQWMRNADHTGYVSSSEVLAIYRENCISCRIEQHCERDVLRTLKKHLRKQRLVKLDERGRKRKLTFYFLPPQDSE